MDRHGCVLVVRGQQSRREKEAGEGELERVFQ